MKIESYKSGEYIERENYKYFLPSFINHTFTWDDEVINVLLEKASFKIGELNGYTHYIPDIEPVINMFINKEAIASSRIEGITVDINDYLYTKEDSKELKSVRNLVNAFNVGFSKERKCVFFLELIKESHRDLFPYNGGAYKQEENWIGGNSINNAIYVPPARENLSDLMIDLEKFLNNEEINVPTLIKIAIAHYQFETIHPFFDGNGRIGRLMIPLFFVSKGILDKPLLYMSSFFEKNRSLYYDKLTYTRTHNDLNQWIKYFLNGIIETCEESINTLSKVIKLKEEYENKILKLGRRAENAKKLLILLFSDPIVSVTDVSIKLDVSFKTANELLQLFQDENMLKEITNGKRDRLFSFSEYITLFTN